MKRNPYQSWPVLIGGDAVTAGAQAIRHAPRLEKIRFTVPGEGRPPSGGVTFPYPVS